MNSRTALIRSIVVLGIVSFAFLVGCAGGTSSSFNEPIPTPTITTISPNSAVAGGAPFTLTINGTNFVAGTNFGGASMLNFGGAAPATTYVSATQLTAAIPSPAIASGGTAAVTVTTPGGGISNAVNFTISSGTNPVPTIGSLVPSCAPNVGQGFGLAVLGSNFVASSVVRWNGSDLLTAVLSSTQLTAFIPASNLAAAGNAAITVFNAAPGGGSSNTLTFTMGGVGPAAVAVDATGKFAYVANMGCVDFYGDYSDGNVSMYTINPTTGALSSIGSQVAAGYCANSVTVDPFGKFAYVANEGCGDTSGGVSMYTINPASGALTSIGDAPCAEGSCLAPVSVAVNPSGKFAYVATEGGFSPTNVSMYTIDPTIGTLNLIGTVASGGRANSVTVDPSGKFAYVVNGGDPDSGCSVSMFTINATTGVLTSTGTIAAGVFPCSIAVHPSGKFAYVTNSSSNDILMYGIDTSTGTLISIGTMAAGGSPIGPIAIDPTGRFAYLPSGSSDILTYNIDTGTGSLTSVGTTAGTLAVGSIAIAPSGKFAYATSGLNTVLMYSIDAATGALSLIGTVGT
jgi:6-phosphogluconolactonase